MPLILFTALLRWVWEADPRVATSIDFGARLPSLSPSPKTYGFMTLGRSPNLCLSFHTYEGNGSPFPSQNSKRSKWIVCETLRESGLAHGKRHTSVSSYVFADADTGAHRSLLG